nr:TerB N-terminal domain-containing protein [Chloroflexia bacterium]
LGYWPSYGHLSAGERAAYLAWLTGGRRNPSVPIGYVFLFLYGLERRVLLDILDGNGPKSELPAIRGEMADLLDVYGPASTAFREDGQRFVELIDIVLAQSADRPLPPPPIRPDRYEVPTTLKIELGQRAARGIPIPADLALAWAWYLPENSPRTAATRCAAEFARLWAIRFDADYPGGMTLRPGKARVELTYFAANAGLRTLAGCELDIPDVFIQKVPGRKLVALFEGVTNDLDAYSRWLGRNPDGAGSLASFATLPPELATGPSPALDQLAAWASGRLGKNFAVKIPGTEILGLWHTEPTDRMAKTDAVALAQLLGNLGFGMEPDVRFGGAAIAPGTEAVLFASQPDAPHAATPAYSAAATLVHLAAAVGIADGGVSTPEISHLGEHLKSSLGLSPAEMARLYAHFLWLSATDINLSGLRKRLGTMSQEQRTRIGEVMISVAAADGVISPAEVTMLGKIFRLLGLDPSRVTSHLHATLTGGPPRAATRPVTVRPGGAPDPGAGIPPRPTREGSPPSDAAPRPFTLDRAAIDKKLAETAEVGVLLANLFAEEDVARPPQPRPHNPSSLGSQTGQDTLSSRPSQSQLDSRPAPLPSIAGLDPAHSLFLRAVSKRSAWTRAEFEDLAAEHHLMPDGAIDHLNEAAYDLAGEPVVDGDDDLTVNPYALEALLA